MENALVILVGVPGSLNCRDVVATEWPQWRVEDMEGIDARLSATAELISAVPSDIKVIVIFSAANIRVTLALSLLCFLRGQCRDRHLGFVVARTEAADEAWVGDYLNEVREWGGFVSPAGEDVEEWKSRLVGTIIAALG